MATFELQESLEKCLNDKKEITTNFTKWIENLESLYTKSEESRIWCQEEWSAANLTIEKLVNLPYGHPELGCNSSLFFEKAEKELPGFLVNTSCASGVCQDSRDPVEWGFGSLFSLDTNIWNSWLASSFGKDWDFLTKKTLSDLTESISSWLSSDEFKGMSFSLSCCKCIRISSSCWSLK